jgi:hypothetical protein
MTGGAADRRERGQMVLVAAGVLAVALAPMVLAYLQLGYHPDVQASTDYDAPVANAERLLDRAVHEASDEVPGTYDWRDRRDAVDAVRTNLEPRLETLATARIEQGTAYRTSYNQSAAQQWASDNCPGGPDRQFGSCGARRGVVVQERAGRTHVLAVALDVTVTTERGQRAVTLVKRVRGS